MCICVCLYVYVYSSIVEPSGFRVLGFVVALGVPFNKQQLLLLLLHPEKTRDYGALL